MIVCVVGGSPAAKVTSVLVDNHVCEFIHIFYIFPCSHFKIQGSTFVGMYKCMWDCESDSQDSFTWRSTMSAARIVLVSIHFRAWENKSNAYKSEYCVRFLHLFIKFLWTFMPTLIFFFFFTKTYTNKHVHTYISRMWFHYLNVVFNDFSHNVKFRYNRLQRCSAKYWKSFYYVSEIVIKGT